MRHIGLTRAELERVDGLIGAVEAGAPFFGGERRERPRIDFTHPMWVYMPLEGERPWVHVHSRNLSTGGLAFITREGMVPGTYVVVAHHLNEGSSQLALSVVRYCRGISGGLYEVGLEFEAVVKDEGERRIPSEWSTLVLRHLWLSKKAGE